MEDKACAAKGSFCSALKVKKLHLGNYPQLLEKIAGLSVTENLKAEVKASTSKSQHDSETQGRKLQRHNAMRTSFRVQQLTSRKSSEDSKKCQNIAVVGAGKASNSLDEISFFVFKRDFGQLESFTGKEKIGVVYAPPSMVSKYALNLFPDEVDNARKIANEVEQDDDLQKDIYRAKREYDGYKPEFDLLEAIKEALKDCDG